ncbi:MAG: OmpA family protein [Desulfamplus sp.]|nr:OmpA family protein [Desulfamplus sp.]
MNAKLLSFDIARDGIETLDIEDKSKILTQIETQTEEVLSEFINEMSEFSKITMENSSAQQQHFLNKLNNELNIIEVKKEPPDSPIETIEKIIFNITQEKIVAEKEKKFAQERIQELLDIKKSLESDFKRIEVEKAAVENEIAHVEKSIVELQNDREIERNNNEAVINSFKVKLDEYIKITEVKNSENALLSSQNTLLKEKLGNLKKINADIEEQKRVISSELRIAKKELEFIEKKFLSEQTQLHDKISELQEKLESALTEAEILKKDKIKVEFETIQSKKALENSNFINQSLKQELDNKDEYLKNRELEISRKEAEIRDKDKEIKNKELEIRKIQEKSYQNDAIQINKINTLEERLKQNREHYSNKIKEVEDKLSDSLKIANIMEVEKNKSLEAVSKIKKEMVNLESQLKTAKKECISLNGEIDDLKLKLSESQKQKELLIANKLNNTLQIKRDNYIEKRPNKIFFIKFASIAAIIAIIAITSYLTFRNYYHFPMVQKQKELTGTITGLNAQLEIKKRYIDSITIEKTRLADKIDALTKQLSLLQENIKKAEATNVKLPTIPTPVIPIENQLIESVYFNSGNSNLNEKEIYKIRSIAERYNGNPYISIRLEGHTDDKMFRFPLFHQYSNNLHLSVARAAEVSRLLVQYGMDTNQISIVGLGDMYPLVPNDNPEHREKNRRVEIKITDSRRDDKISKQGKIYR